MQCTLEREIYLPSKNSDGGKLKKNCYKALCKSLSSSVTEANCSYYTKLLFNSKNKISTTWKFVKTETGRTNTNEGITTISVNVNLINNAQLILDYFNNISLSIADKILKKL